MANNYFSTWTIKSTENSDKVSHNTHSQPKSLRDTAYEWKRCYYLLAITSKTPFNFQVIEMEHFEVAWSFSADEQVMHILHIGHEWHQFRWINARWPRFPSFSSLITFTAPDLRSGSSPALWPKVFLYGSENFVGKEVKSMGSDKSKATIVLIGSNVSVHSQGNRFDLHGDKSCLLRSIHGTVRLKFTLWCKSVELHSFFKRTIKRFPIFGVLRLLFVFISISYMHLSLQFIFIVLPTFMSTFTFALYKMLDQEIKFESNAFFTRIIIFLLVVLRDCHFYDFLDLIHMFFFFYIQFEKSFFQLN